MAHNSLLNTQVGSNYKLSIWPVIPVYTCMHVLLEVTVVLQLAENKAIIIIIQLYGQDPYL